MMEDEKNKKNDEMLKEMKAMQEKMQEMQKQLDNKVSRETPRERTKQGAWISFTIIIFVVFMVLWLIFSQDAYWGGSIPFISIGGGVCVYLLDKLGVFDDLDDDSAELKKSEKREQFFTWIITFMIFFIPISLILGAIWLIWGLVFDFNQKFGIAVPFISIILTYLFMKIPDPIDETKKPNEPPKS